MQVIFVYYCFTSDDLNLTSRYIHGTDLLLTCWLNTVVIILLPNGNWTIDIMRHHSIILRSFLGEHVSCFLIGFLWCLAFWHRKNKNSSSKFEWYIGKSFTFGWMPFSSPILLVSNSTLEWVMLSVLRTRPSSSSSPSRSTLYSPYCWLPLLGQYW